MYLLEGESDPLKSERMQILLYFSKYNQLGGGGGQTTKRNNNGQVAAAIQTLNEHPGGHDFYSPYPV